MGGISGFFASKKLRFASTFSFPVPNQTDTLKGNGIGALTLEPDQLTFIVLQQQTHHVGFSPRLPHRFPEPPVFLYRS